MSKPWFYELLSACYTHLTAQKRSKVLTFMQSPRGGRKTKVLGTHKGHRIRSSARTVGAERASAAPLASRLRPERLISCFWRLSEASGAGLGARVLQARF